jgi:hypothetical protein
VSRRRRGLAGYRGGRRHYRAERRHRAPDDRVRLRQRRALPASSRDSDRPRRACTSTEDATRRQAARLSVPLRRHGRLPRPRPQATSRRTGPRFPGRAPDRQRLAAITAAARTAAPFVPFEGECLQRAYLLRRLLRNEGYSPLWVFGVRTWPFGAHCWLQIDDLVVGDTLDRVRFYTPIMAA